MNIEIGDYLTLSDGIEYIVVSIASYNSNIYYCLMDIKNNENIKFCTKEDNNIVFVNKDTIDADLLKKLYNESKKIIKNE